MLLIVNGKKFTNNSPFTSLDGYIFDFDNSKGIEAEDSNFNTHRVDVIKYSIEKNLSVAISNYNNYSGVTVDFQMPKLKDTDWDKIMDNIYDLIIVGGGPGGIAAAVEAGYVKGITDTEFAPDKTITREEACTILGRAYAKTSDKALNFTDASGISDFATAYVALLVDMGYVNGYEDGTFLPKNEITRAEAAKIIASAFRAAEKAKTEVTEDKTEAKNNADADVKADDKTDAKADDKTDAKADAKTDAKADNGETPEK